MAAPCPEPVFLIHGTFSYRDEPDTSGGPPNWWQPGSEFAESMDGLFEGRAKCWPDDACIKMPWFGKRIGHRIENWQVGARQPFRRLRPKHRVLNRKMFAWSGLNNENERRKAGKRLYEGLLKLEQDNAARVARDEPPVGYHLIGHSHGGSVIWDALRRARHRETLPNLKSWTTLGTPFPTYEAIPWRWLVGLLGLLAMALGILFVLRYSTDGTPLLGPDLPRGWAGWWGVIAALFAWNSPANLYHHGLSPGSIFLAVVLLAIGAVFFAWVLRWAGAKWTCRRIRKAREDAWRAFGDRWLGIFSEIDEAIAGTQSSVGLYISDIVRIPWPAPGTLVTKLLWAGAIGGVLALAHFSGLLPTTVRPGDFAIWLPLAVLWVVELTILASLAIIPVANWVVLPLAEWVASLLFRQKFQGAPAGTQLTLMSPEPFDPALFPDTATGPLPEPLAGPLHARAHDKAERGIFKVRGAFAANARSARSPKELLRDYFRDIKLTGELVHNSYYEIDDIRRLMADRVLAPVPPPSVADFTTPPNREYRPARKPPNNTPLVVYALLLAAFCGLWFAGFDGLRNDIRGPYVEQLGERIGATGETRDEHLAAAFNLFRPLTEAGLVRSVGQQDVEIRLNGLAFLENWSSDPSHSCLTDNSLLEVVRLGFDETTDRQVGAAAIQLLLAQNDQERVADALVDRWVELAGSEQVGDATPERVGPAILATLGSLDSGPIATSRRIVRILRAANVPSAVSYEAARALGALGAAAAPEAVTPLLAALRDTHPFVRNAAADALGALGAAAAPAAVTPLVAALLDTDPT